MYEEAIDNQTKNALDKLKESELIQSFYLAGGTALAFQLGHRKSIDLDWFSKEGFSNEHIKKEVANLGKFKLSSEDEGTVHGVLDNARITFLHYDYELLYPFIDFNGVNLADEREIAAMKLSAISSRGSKKDFIDLYFLLKKYSLQELIDIFEKKYSNIEYNKAHLLKSLTYFAEAEEEPMPVMRKKATWEEVKKILAQEVGRFANLR